MYYRSYGLLLFVIALMVSAQGFRDNTPLGATIAGLILLIDLPLRWIGTLTPWDDCDKSWWAIARYRGSHIFLIPTWIVGVFALGVGAASFLSPSFHTFLHSPLVNRKGDTPPPKDPPAPPVMAGTLEVDFEEIAPFDGNTFRYKVHNRTNGKLKAVMLAFLMLSPKGEELKSGWPTGDLDTTAKHSEVFHASGISPIRGLFNVQEATPAG